MMKATEAMLAGPVRSGGVGGSGCGHCGGGGAQYTNTHVYEAHPYAQNHLFRSEPIPTLTN